MDGRPEGGRPTDDSGGGPPAGQRGALQNETEGVPEGGPGGARGDGLGDAPEDDQGDLAGGPVDDPGDAPDQGGVPVGVLEAGVPEGVPGQVVLELPTTTAGPGKAAAVRTATRGRQSDTRQQNDDALRHQ